MFCLKKLHAYSKIRDILYEHCIVFQVIPKLLTYQVFAFAYIGAINSNLIIPFAVFVPLSICLFRLLVYYVM